MSKKVLELQQKRGQVVTQMKTIVDAAEAEDRGLTAEERGQWDGMNKDVEQLEERIKTVELSESRYTEMNDAVANALPKGDTGGQAPEDRSHEGPTLESSFNAYMRFGMQSLSKEERAILMPHKQELNEAERRALAAGTDTAGGYTVPEGFAGFITDGMKAFGGIRDVSTVLTTESGNPLPFPENDDTGNSGALLAENTGDTENDLTFGVETLGAHKYTSRIIRVPVELMQDSAFDLEAYLSGKFGERLGRATSAHYGIGTGVGQPQGLSVGASAGPTTASGTAITYGELIDLKHSVDPAYRANARYVMNDNSLRAIKGLLDSAGRPLFIPDPAAAGAGTIDGDDYVIDQSMPALAVNNRAIVYGDISKYYIRDVAGFSLARLAERYAEFHQVGFIAFMRTDARLIDAGAGSVKALVQAAV